MFDLDRELHTFLKDFNRKSLVSREALDEIESHLRDDIDDLLAAGCSSQEAFERALRNFGEGKKLLQEFDNLYANRRWAQIGNTLSHYLDRRFIMRLLFGIVLGLFFIIGGTLLEGGHISGIIQITAAMIVVGGSFAGLTIAYPWQIVRKSFVLALTGRQAVRSAYIDAAKVFQTFGDLAVFAGLVGSLIGMAHVFELIYPQRYEVMGPGLAVATVNLIYSFLIKLLVAKPMSDSFNARAFPSSLDKEDGSRSGDERRMA